MTDFRFSCTMCGNCCHDHNLPLTVDEAIAWVEGGGQIQIYCEAAAWPIAPAATEAEAAYRRRRSFAARCGTATIHVAAVLAGVVKGPCRHLGADMRCTIYDRRPLVCRIYPAEINPFFAFETERKACPPEAWAAGEPLVADNEPVDGATRALIAEARRRDAEDAPRKRLLCRRLGVHIAAVAGEGFAVYPRNAGAILKALHESKAAPADEGPDDIDWRLYSPRAAGAESLQASGFDATTEWQPSDGYWYVGAPALKMRAKAAA